MIGRQLATLLFATSLITIACDDDRGLPAAPDGPALAGIPADGQGRKEIFPLSFDAPVTCPNGTVLGRHIEGWVQVLILNSPTNVELDVFHNTVEFSNSAGGYLKIEGVGTDLYSLDGNDLIVASVGPNPPLGLVGRIVVDLTTGEVTFVAGKESDPAVVRACAELA